jgi:outer membrane PBP1 activator LpoA protein
MRRTMGAVPLLAALCLAACGGSDGSSSRKSTAAAAPKPLTRSALVARANAICRRAKTKIDAVDVPSNIQDATQAAKYFSQVSDLSDATMADLRRLKAPASIAADWTAYIGKQQEYINLIHTLRDKAEAGDRSGLRDLQRAPTLNRQTNAAANKVGAKVCGSDN